MRRGACSAYASAAEVTVGSIARNRGGSRMSSALRISRWRGVVSVRCRTRPAAALALEAQNSMALVVAEVLDVPKQRLGDAQTVVGEQGDEGRRAGSIRLRRGDEAAQFIPGEPGGGGVVRDAGPGGVGEGRLGDGAVVALGVAVEAGQRREAPAHARRRLADLPWSTREPTT